jgi:co-chaperonin GroES (HSP10)
MNEPSVRDVIEFDPFRSKSAADGEVPVFDGMAEPIAQLQASRHLKAIGDRVIVRRQDHRRQVGLIVLVGGKRDDLCVSKVLSVGSDAAMGSQRRLVQGIIDALEKDGDTRAASLVTQRFLPDPGEPEYKVGDYVAHPRVVGAKYDNVLGRLDDDGEIVVLHDSELMFTVDPAIVETVRGESVYNDKGECDYSKK